MTCDSTVNSITYKCGEFLFISIHFYDTPAKINAIRRISDTNNVLIDEDLAESLEATYKKKQIGNLDDYNIISTIRSWYV